MKAIRVHEFGGPEVLRLEEVDELRPGESQLLVRLAAAGVNPVDTYKREGRHAHSPPAPPACRSSARPGLRAAGGSSPSRARTTFWITPPRATGKSWRR